MNSQSSFMLKKNFKMNKKGSLFNITLVMLLTITSMFYLFYQTNPDVKPQEVLSNMSTVHESTYSITKDVFYYTNLYNTTPNVTNVVMNIGHGLVYGIITEYNTAVPVGAHIAKGDTGKIVYKILKLIIIIWLIFNIPKLLAGIAIIYFFIKEKRRNKEKWYQ